MIQTIFGDGQWTWRIEKGKNGMRQSLETGSRTAGRRRLLLVKSLQRRIRRRLVSSITPLSLTGKKRWTWTKREKVKVQRELQLETFWCGDQSLLINYNLLTLNIQIVMIGSICFDINHLNIHNLENWNLIINCRPNWPNLLKGKPKLDSVVNVLLLLSDD